MTPWLTSGERNLGGLFRPRRPDSAFNDGAARTVRWFKNPSSPDFARDDKFECRMQAATKASETRNTTQHNTTQRDATDANIMSVKRKRSDSGSGGGGGGQMSIRQALKKLREKAEVETKQLKGNFHIDGPRLTIGDDLYHLIKVPGEGDCAFDTMVYIIHAIINGNTWRGPEDAYKCTGVGSADELRRAFDSYRKDFPRDGAWGDQFDWVVFCAMFGVTVNIISYSVSATGFENEMHSVISSEVLGQKAYVPGFVKVPRESLDSGLHAYVCNHYDTHYDPMRLVKRS